MTNYVFGILGVYPITPTMSEHLKPFEAELFFLFEKRRERMGFANITQFYAWALNKDQDSAYRQYYRLKNTSLGLAKTSGQRAHLSLEDAMKIARALQIDLSVLIRQVEEKLQLDQKPFPTPDKSRLSKIRKNQPNKIINLDDYR